MVDTSDTNWENFVRTLLNRLDIPTKADIAVLHGRLDKLEQLLQKRPAAARTVKKKKAAAKPAPRENASSIVLGVIAEYPEGTDFKTIQAATGYDEKKLRNIIFRLDKIKRIERVSRGIYKKTI